MAIRNVGESANLKVITQNKITANRTSKCLEIPHDTIPSNVGQHSPHQEHFQNRFKMKISISPELIKSLS